MFISYYNGAEGRLEHDVVGRMSKIGVDARTVATSLLSAFRKCDEDSGRFHSLEAHWLTAAEIERIANDVWGVEVLPDKSRIPIDLRAAYAETEFRVFGPKDFTLQIGVVSEALRAVYDELGVTSAAYLTAWNPFSQDASPAENAAAQQNLQNRISDLGYVTWNGLGIDPSGDLPGEDSVFVPGMDRSEAIALGTKYRQNAIVWADADAVPQLILLR